MSYTYFDRDLSWLSFNERILMESARAEVPLLERLNFLSIFSSNLDEFYRVRIPAIIALNSITYKESEFIKEDAPASLLRQVTTYIDRLQASYGKVLIEQIIPLMEQQDVFFLYNKEIPAFLRQKAKDYFYDRMAAFIQVFWADVTPGPEGPTSDKHKTLQEETTKENKAGRKKRKSNFFPENGHIYLAVFIRTATGSQIGIINIPSEDLSRFYQREQRGVTYVLLIDDIVRMQLPVLLGKTNPTAVVEGCYSFKMTRDAAVDYKDDYKKDLAGFIQRQIVKRTYGLATRLLYDGDMPEEKLKILQQLVQCEQAVLVKGGRYHNLKDLSKFPVNRTGWTNMPWPALRYAFSTDQNAQNIFEEIAEKDQMISPPYHNYNAVLRFFNEAAVCPEVEEIAVTLYRIAGDSLIAHALISAARNGKKVTVFVELKARFDEANNVKWARKLKAAGVRIIYSIWAMKVHAKVGLVKLRSGERLRYFGIFATGNFNENTAAFYADHILMTAHKGMVAELETLLLFLEKRQRPDNYRFYEPSYLLVAGFNLQKVFLQKIDQCIQAALKGQPARIVVKVNNLEEKSLIDKLYEASKAGVKIELIVRSICRLVPGMPDMSEQISVRRLLDRYLEHSRVFIFSAASEESVYLGSADWMNRNIYRRIEVCFPVLDPDIAEDIKKIIALQLSDNTQAVQLNAQLENQCIREPDAPSRSAQREIWQYLDKQSLN